jgi:hypothetical protein
MEGYNNNNKFWEELIAYLPLIRHAPQMKRKIGGTHGHIDSILFFQNTESALKGE